MVVCNRFRGLIMSEWEFRRISAHILQAYGDCSIIDARSYSVDGDMTEVIPWNGQGDMGPLLRGSIEPARS